MFKPKHLGMCECGAHFFAAGEASLLLMEGAKAFVVHEAGKSEPTRHVYPKRPEFSWPGVDLPD